MKEIKYYPNKFCIRSEGIKKIEVDDNELDFINGIAVAKAKVSGLDYNKKNFSYECYGLINERFEEVYDDKYPSSRYLMFAGYNQDIIRCGVYDFIVKVNCESLESSVFKYRHVHINGDKSTTLISDDIGKCIKTSNEKILIAKNRLYDVKNGAYLTHEFSHVEEIAPNTFLVLNSVVEEDETIDYLVFYLNEKGQLISSITSLATGISLPVSKAKRNSVETGQVLTLKK